MLVTWSELPDATRRAVERYCGNVTKVEHPSAGLHSEFSATINGEVFVKGSPPAGPNLWMHRDEARVNGCLPALAPRLLWAVETAGWLLHGFEYVPGHHADLKPESPDLPLVAEAVAELRSTLTPCPDPAAKDFAEQWQKLSAWQRLRADPPAELHPWTRAHLAHFADQEPKAINATRGNSLAHTDLHSANILVDERAAVIDWAWARRAANWVDAAFVVIRLIHAGHSPQDAEACAPPDAPPESLSLFAAEVLGVWEYLQHHRPQPHRTSLTNAARKWTRHRHSYARS